MHPSPTDFRIPAAALPELAPPHNSRFLSKPMSSTPATTVTRRVEFAETDMAGILHFSNFFRFMESAEAALFRELGAPLIETGPGSLRGFPRARASCDFSAPVRFGEQIEISLFVEEVRSRSIHYRFSFHRIEPGPRLRVAKGVMITVFATLNPDTGAITPTDLPDELRRQLIAKQESSGNMFDS